MHRSAFLCPVNAWRDSQASCYERLRAAASTVLTGWDKSLSNKRCPKQIVYGSTRTSSIRKTAVKGRGVLAHDPRVSRCQKRRDSRRSTRLTHVQGASSESHNLFNMVEDSRKLGTHI